MKTKLCPTIEHFTVQEEPAKGPVQGDCTGNIPVFDWLLADSLRGSSSGRNHKGRGEFWSVNVVKSIQKANCTDGSINAIEN